MKPFVKRRKGSAMTAAVLVKVPASCKVRDRGTKPRGAVSQLCGSVNSVQILQAYRHGLDVSVRGAF